MEKFKQFIGKSYYEFYDELQDLAVENGFYICLIEDDLDYNIDYDSLRIKIFVNEYGEILKVRRD